MLNLEFVMHLIHLLGAYNGLFMLFEKVIVFCKQVIVRFLKCDMSTLKSLDFGLFPLDHLSVLIDEVDKLIRIKLIITITFTVTYY